MAFNTPARKGVVRFKGILYAEGESYPFLLWSQTPRRGPCKGIELNRLSEIRRADLLKRIRSELALGDWIWIRTDEEEHHRIARQGLIDFGLKCTQILPLFGLEPFEHHWNRNDERLVLMDEVSPRSLDEAQREMLRRFREMFPQGIHAGKPDQGSVDCEGVHWADCEVDLSYAPKSYWGVPQSVVARIKGEYRRAVVDQLLREGRYDEIDAWLMQEDLPSSVFRFLQKVSPGRTAGETLPDFLPGELEIARVVLKNGADDVISVRAQQRADRICYRVVGEHDDLYSVEPTFSRSPLALSELIAMLASYVKDGINGLTQWLREQRFVWGVQPGGLLTYVRVTSDFYPNLQVWYEHESLSWCKQKEGCVQRNRSAACL